MSAPYSALSVANELIELGLQEDKPVTPLQLLKLVYFSHGWHLAFFKKPLVKERFEAWKFGPVCPTLYHTFKGYRMRPIDELAETLDASGLSRIVPRIPDGDEHEKARGIVDAVWRAYGGFDGYQLSAITHRPNTAWSIVWEKEGKDRPGTDIPDNFIAAEFTETMRNAKAPTGA